MAVVIKEGNVFDSDAKIICHQVNCQGVMGSGVAKEVRERYPKVYEEYHIYCESNKDCPERMLGVAQMVPVDEKVLDGSSIASVRTVMDMTESSTRLLAHCLKHSKKWPKSPRHRESKWLCRMGSVVFVAVQNGCL